MNNDLPPPSSGDSAQWWLDNGAVKSQVDGNLVRALMPDREWEVWSLWWGGEVMTDQDVMQLEMIVGNGCFRFTGERRELVTANPITLGGMEMKAMFPKPDPATLEIRENRKTDQWEPVTPGSWIVRRRPHQPPQKLVSSGDAPAGNVDPELVEAIRAKLDAGEQVNVTGEPAPPTTDELMP